MNARKERMQGRKEAKKEHWNKKLSGKVADKLRSVYIEFKIIIMYCYELYMGSYRSFAIFWSLLMCGEGKEKRIADTGF
jgi:hypothetical protein